MPWPVFGIVTAKLIYRLSVASYSCGPTAWMPYVLMAALPEFPDTFLI